MKIKPDHYKRRSSDENIMKERILVWGERDIRKPYIVTGNKGRHAFRNPCKVTFGLGSYILQ